MQGWYFILMLLMAGSTAAANVEDKALPIMKSFAQKYQGFETAIMKAKLITPKNSSDFELTIYNKVNHDSKKEYIESISIALLSPVPKVLSDPFNTLINSDGVWLFKGSPLGNFTTGFGDILWLDAKNKVSKRYSDEERGALFFNSNFHFEDFLIRKVEDYHFKYIDEKVCSLGNCHYIEASLKMPMYQQKSMVAVVSLDVKDLKLAKIEYKLKGDRQSLQSEKENIINTNGNVSENENKNENDKIKESKDSGSAVETRIKPSNQLKLKLANQDVIRSVELSAYVKINQRYWLPSRIEAYTPVNKVEKSILKLSGFDIK